MLILQVEGALNYSHTIWEHDDNLAKLARS